MSRRSALRFFAGHHGIVRISITVLLHLPPFGGWLDADELPPPRSRDNTKWIINGEAPPRYQPQVIDSWQGPVPTSDWYSSVVFENFGRVHYPHPGAVAWDSRGLRLFDPGRRMGIAPRAVMGGMPPTGDRDLMVSPRSASSSDSSDVIEQVRLVEASDWFIHLRGSGPWGDMDVRYGHGSPFVQIEFEKGNASLAFAEVPEIKCDPGNPAAILIRVGANYYAAFGPSGSMWKAVGPQRWENDSPKRYCTLAVMPDGSLDSLAAFASVAHHHIVDTTCDWNWDRERGVVEYTFRARFKTQEGEHQEAGTSTPSPSTFWALYPHQWRHTNELMTSWTYSSVRGPMKVIRAAEFVVTLPVVPMLPGFPAFEMQQADRWRRWLREAIAERNTVEARDTYWQGKQLGHLAELASAADAQDQLEARDQALATIQSILESWFAARAPGGRFRYHNLWGSVIGEPASYGSDTDLSDHHFHYGYWIRAAAEVARHDRTGAWKETWGDAVEGLIDDMACPERDHPSFPRLRVFDLYAGHSWASGTALFHDGNNQESSSEAMNAWFAIVAWGEAVGDERRVELGVALAACEAAAIRDYWFDVEQDSVPAGGPTDGVAMIWGGKSVEETWFSPEPEAVFGINWLPIHAGTLHLIGDGQTPRKQYAAVRRRREGPWQQWADLLWMMRALDDPQEARSEFERDHATAPLEGGGSLAHTDRWIGWMQFAGTPVPHLVADQPFSAVFRNDSEQTYVVHVRQAGNVRFNDGSQFSVQPGWNTFRRPAPSENDLR